jgi:DNA-binding CsgD family transcriptional regulator/tetratricopeptide (TPR) repeat protein
VWPFVAREGELDAMNRILAEPDAGGVVIVGPAGVGKTWLADEIVSVAGHRNVRCLRVHASPTARGYAAVAALSRALAPGRAVLLVVDDIDQLDPDSMTVVHQLVANRMTQLVATVRLGTRMPEGVAALWRTGRLHRLDLAPLDQPDLVALMSRALDGPVSSITADRVHRITQGNPLYLRELLRQALDTGALTLADGVWQLDDAPMPPGRLGDLLDGALDEVTPSERRVLELVALADGLGLRMLHQLSDGDVVESLERRGLLEVRPDGRRVSLTHPMYAEILCRGLPATTRMRHCRALADMWERMDLREPDELLRWANWRLEGGDLESEADTALMAEAARHATAARVRPALREALARFAWCAGGDPDTGLLLVSALFDLGRHDEAYAVLADVTAAASGSGHTHPRVALARSFYLGWGAGRLTRALTELESIVDSLTDDVLRAEADAQRGLLLATAGLPGPALRLVEPLLGVGSPRTRGRASTAAAMAYLLTGELPRAMRLARAAHAIYADAAEHQAWTEEAAGLAGLCVRVLADAGHGAEARRFGEKALRSAARSGDAHGVAWVAGALAALELSAGNLDQARHHGVEASAYFRKIRSAAGLAWSLGILLMVAVQQGKGERAEEISTELERLRPDEQEIQLCHVEVDRARAWYGARYGDRHAACRRLAARGAYWLERGATAPAAVIAADLARLGSPGLGEALLAACDLPPDWALGSALSRFVAACERGDHEGLESASATFEELGVVTYAADAMAAAANAGGAAISSRERSRLEAAAAGLAALCGNPRTPLLASLAEGRQLTRREREIGRMAMQGMSNKEIAAKLTVSGRTVENHLAHVYAKLGVRGRDDLVRWLPAAR